MYAQIEPVADTFERRIMKREYKVAPSPELRRIVILMDGIHPL